MKKLSILGLGLLLSASSLMAQNVRPVTNLRNGQFPQLTADNRGIFQIKASDAKEVIVDIGGKKYPMTKDDKGVWTATTDVLMSGINYYFLYVDGVQISDPASETFYGCSRMSSCIEVPYKKVTRASNLPTCHMARLQCADTTQTTRVLGAECSSIYHLLIRKTSQRPILCSTYSMAVVRMSVVGLFREEQTLSLTTLLHRARLMR